MSETKALPTQLPSTEHDFVIEIEGNLTRRSFKGNFKYRVPSLRERAQADVHRAKLNGGQEPRALDPVIADLHEKISYLRYVLIETPSWWKDADHGYALLDYNVVDKVHSECVAYEDLFMAQVWPERVQKEEGAK